MITAALQGGRDPMAHSYLFEGPGSSYPTSMEHTRKLERGHQALKEEPEEDEETETLPEAIVEEYLIDPALVTKEMRQKMKQGRVSLS